MTRHDAYEDERQWQSLQRLMHRQPGAWRDAVWWVVGTVAVIDLLWLIR